MSSSTITTKDGTEIYYKDWGSGPAIVFHHGWPLSADDWDAQMMFFLAQGIPGHRARPARSRPLVADRNGNEMDTYAADVAALAAHLDLRDAVHVGHSTGGGEVARYVARHGAGRVAKAVLIGAVPPVMVKSDKNPGGTADRSVRRLPRGARRQSRAVLPRHAERPVLRLQSSRREGLAGRDRQLVAPGNDGRHQGALRLHQGVLRNGLHRGPEEDRRAGAGHARRRRSDRPDRGFRVAVGKLSRRGR